MNLARINLNLLLVFDAMMSTHSATRAGQALGLSQSAISNSIAQLRDVLDDPLFIRTSNEMVPTARAVALSGPIRDALAQMREALSRHEGFSPTESDRVFRIGMSDYSAFVLLGQIVRSARASAKGIRICVRNIGAADIPAALDNDEADICLGFPPPLETWHQQETVFDDDWVCVRNSRPGGGRAIGMAEYIAANHVVVGQDWSNHIDRLLARGDMKRANMVSVPYCLVSPMLAEGTDLLVTLPRRLALEFVRGRPIDILELPFQSKVFSMSMVWHAKNELDSGVTWLRDLVRSSSGLSGVDAPAAVPPPRKHRHLAVVRRSV